MRAAISAEEAARLVRDGASVMTGGVLAGGIARAVVSGSNPLTQTRTLAGETEAELVPQGTPAERIRAATAAPLRLPDDVPEMRLAPDRATG